MVIDEKLSYNEADKRKNKDLIRYYLSQCKLLMEDIMNRTMTGIVYEDILPHLKYLSNEVDKYGLDMVMDGVKVFESGDRFVPGKIINGASFVLTMTQVDDEFIEQFKSLIRFSAPLYIETWGYMNYIQGLYRLHLGGRLEEMLDEETLVILKESLDWRHFVNIEDLSLIQKPTNYYGVAFGLAKYRELLGWDEGNYSDLLFDKLMDHILEFSGDYSYMDETPGEGRFDRYSILIPGELCSILHGTGMEIPPLLIKMLKQSANLCIRIANEEGQGISYGRSIGAYGDTAILEILSIAGLLGILDETELEIAYGYCQAIINTFTDFWLDKQRKSVNLWDRGRATDEYRHKGRILGENYSLCCQVIHTYQQWLESKYVPSNDKNWLELIKELPKHEYFCFAKGEFERGLAIVRRDKHIFMLPIINGGGGSPGNVRGKSYHYATPYLPIPQENNCLENIADSHLPNLVPRIVDQQGLEYMPVSYIKSIEEIESSGGYKLILKQDVLCQIGERYPISSEIASLVTEYEFIGYEIIRRDTFTFENSSQIKEVYMEFYTFSQMAKRDSNQVSFESGSVTSFEVDGLKVEDVIQLRNDVAMNTPHGQLKTKVIVRKQDQFENIFKMSWKLSYK